MHRKYLEKDSTGHLFGDSAAIRAGECLSLIHIYVEFMVGLASFYTLSMFGMAFTKTAVLSILSGGVVPLALFPEGVARVFGLLPFAGMVSVPLNIFLGKYRLEECMGYMGLQIFWCIIMGAIAHLLYHMVIRKVIVQGG